MNPSIHRSAGLRGLVASLLLVLITSYSPPFTSDKPRQLVKATYLADLARLDSAVSYLQISVQKRRPAPVVQAAFRRARLAYKRVEFLTELYFSGSARALNGPPLPEGEVEDGIGTVIQPKGFQVIEEMIFPLDATQWPELLRHLALIQSTVSQVRRVANYNELTDSQVFDALRLEIFRLITLGITGFDSPVALHSLPEAIAALETVDRTTQIYSPVAQDSTVSNQLHQAIGQAIRALRGQSFNQFDRLTFIRQYAYPVSRQLRTMQLALGYPLSTDKRLLRPTSWTLSDTSAFDPTFFMGFGQPQPTPDRVALGKMLFFDPVLSSNGQRTCASCHQPERDFTDGESSPLALGSGKQRIRRNTPTLFNAALQSFQFMDSRSFFLEDQIVDVVHNQQEMGGSLKNAVIALRKDSTYRTRFRKAYADSLTEPNLKNALAAYVRSLVSLNARPDRFLRGEQATLTDQEKLGFNVFMGKGKCATCHFFPLFNGTIPPTYLKTESEVLGSPATAAERQPDSDEGRYKTTHLAIHQKAFKTPTVRHTVHTAPYMHNGVYKTLEQVVEFYNKGGGAGLGFTLENQTLPPEKLNLTAAEKRALVGFMKAL